MVQMQNNSNKVALNVPCHICRQITQPVKSLLLTEGYPAHGRESAYPAAARLNHTRPGDG